MSDQEVPSEEKPIPAMKLGRSNDNLAHGLRMFARVLNLGAGRSMFFPAGTASRVYPLVLNACAASIELYAQPQITVSFVQLMEISRSEATVRKKKDYWKTADSVLQAYYKFRQMHPTGEVVLDGREIRMGIVFEKESSRDVLRVRVRFWSRDEDGHRCEVSVNGEPTWLHALPMDAFFWQDASFTSAAAVQELMLRGQAALASRLLDRPARLVVGQRVEFSDVSSDVATVIEWGDGTKSAVSRGRIAHAYRRPGRFTITLHRRGAPSRIIPDAVEVLALNPEMLTKAEQLYQREQERLSARARAREKNGNRSGA